MREDFSKRENIMKKLNVLMILALTFFYSCSKSTDSIDSDSEEIEMVDGEGEWGDDEVEMDDSGEEDIAMDDESDFDEDGDFSEEGDDELELASNDGDDFDDEFGDDDLDLDDDDLELADDDTLEEGDLLADGGDDFSIDDDELSGSAEETSIASSDDMGGDAGYVDAAPSMPMDNSYESSAPMDAGYANTSVPSGETSNYTVQSNETLMIIAFKLYGDYSRWKEIAALNASKLGGGTNISRGMSLAYSTSGAGFSFNPSGSPYLIQRGDTLGRISSRTYGTSSKWRSIWENNRPLIQDPNKIFAGFTIYLPEDGVRDLASVQAPVEPAFEEEITQSPEASIESAADSLDDADFDDFPEEI